MRRVRRSVRFLIFAPEATVCASGRGCALRKRALRSVIAAASLLGVTGSAAASNPFVPDASTIDVVQGIVTTQEVTGPPPTSAEGSANIPGAGFQDSIAFTEATGPVADAYGFSGGTLASQSSAEVDSHFVIAGGEKPDALVQITAFFAASAQTYGSGENALAGIGILYFDQTDELKSYTSVLQVSANDGSADPVYMTKEITFDIDVEVGTYADVIQTASCGGYPPDSFGPQGPPDGTGAVCTAFSDPLIAIDPAFLTQDPGAALYASPNIQLSLGAVPEPSTWALLMLGFAGLGLVSQIRLRARQLGPPDAGNPSTFARRVHA